MVDIFLFGKSGWVVHFNGFLFVGDYPVRYVGHCGNYAHVEFAVEALLDNFHVQQTQEATTETKAQRQ